MIRGPYTSTCGMLLESTKQDIIANNMANVDTPGFKLDRLAVKTVPEWRIHRIDDNKLERIRLGIDPAPYIGNLGTGVAVQERYTNQEQGPIVHTGNKFDLAIEGEGFFVVETPKGIRFTRAGNLKRSSEGYIVDNNNNKVWVVDRNFSISSKAILVGDDGRLNTRASYLKLQDGREFSVGRDGMVFDGSFSTDRILTIKFEHPEFLQKSGSNYFEYVDKRIGSGTFADNSIIHQGSLEGSNVKSVNEMVKMISLFRSFEMQQKLIQTQDEELGKAVNNIARVG